MYTYVIIDDEKLIRLGLISRLKEITTETFECVGQAANGADGLAVIEETHPDIVITDMKMTKMDGVEFLQKLTGVHPEIPVIVISGYKAFDYMNEAIEQGVVGYVLKPFSTEEIEKQLLKAVAKLEQRKNIARMKEKVDTFESQTRGNEFLKILLGPWQGEKAEDGKNYTNQWHLLISIYTNKPEAMYFLRECANRYLDEAIPLCLENPGSKGQFFVVCSGSEKDICKTEEELPRFLDGMKRKCIGNKLFVAVGKRFYGLEKLNRSYQKNEKMLRDIHLNEKLHVFYEEDYIYTENTIFSDEDIRHILIAMKYNRNDLMQKLHMFFQKFSIEKHSLRDMGKACRSLLNQVDDWAVQNQVETDDIMSVFYGRYRYQTNLEKMEKEISGYINLIAMSVERKSYGDEYIYEQMIKYIHEHYPEKITLQTLANQFYVSPVWCSNIFKDRMNKSLNTCLTDIRIGKAKEMLDNTEMSVEQISREIGYPNPKYFFRMFKQITTFTPIEYRNRRK